MSETARVRYLELRPQEFRDRLAQLPIAWLPLGTLEWHGEQNALGADALISEGLMIRAARRFGGIVMPPLFLGPDRMRRETAGEYLVGMDYDDVTVPHQQLDGSCYWVPQGFFDQLLDMTLEQIRRAGFRSVFADGHGPSRKTWCDGITDREARFGLRLFGVTPDIQQRWKCQMDHAAKNETSILMALYPKLVDLSTLSSDRKIWPKGVGGEDPRDASAKYGEECLTESLEVIGEMVQHLG